MMVGLQKGFGADVPLQHRQSYVGLGVPHRDHAQFSATLHHAENYIRFHLLDVGLALARLSRREIGVIGFDYASEQSVVLRGLADAVAEIPDALIVLLRNAKVPANL